MKFDQIIKIEELKEEKTIDITVDDHVFYANDILTHNSGFGGAEIDLTNTAESIGTTTVADIIYGITQTDELREARKFCFILLKNRYGLNKLKCLVNINYSRMRLSDDSEDDEVKDNQRKSFAVVDDAAVSVIKKIKNNKKTDIKNIIDMGDDE